MSKSLKDRNFIDEWNEVRHKRHLYQLKLLANAVYPKKVAKALSTDKKLKQKDGSDAS